MRILECDLHVRQQTLAMLDTVTGEVVNRTLMHEGNQVREFYSELQHPVLVGIEAIGPMQWFLKLLEELGIECQVNLCGVPLGNPTTWILAGGSREEKPRGHRQLRGTTDAGDRRYRWRRDFQLKVENR